jgi:hypothetical protein
VLVVLLRRVARGSQGLAAATAALAVVGISASLFLFIDTKASGGARFWLEYPAFVAAATVKVPGHGAGDLYGAELPRHLCVVAPNCRIANLGDSNGAPVRYLADSFEGTYGYGHFAGTPEPGPYNGFGIPVCPTMVPPEWTYSPGRHRQPRSRSPPPAAALTCPTSGAGHTVTRSCSSPSAGM